MDREPSRRRVNYAILVYGHLQEKIKVLHIRFNLFSLIGLLLLAACDPVSMPSLSPLTTVQVSATPPTCNARNVERFIEDFVEAFNRGDQTELAKFFDETFTGYGVGEHFTWDGTNDRYFRTQRRDELLAYFAQRHQQHERQEIVWLGVGEQDFGRAFGLSFALKRQADDLNPGPIDKGITEGKGRVKCIEGRVTIDVFTFGSSLW